MKKIFHKLWQRWLVVSIPLNIISLLVAICFVDSKSWIPLVIILVNLAWLALMMVANSDEGKEDRKNGENS